MSEYGRTKLAGETIIREEIGHIPWVVLRPPPVYGPRDKDIFKAIRVVKAGLKPVFGSGRQLLPMIHVHDLARALVLAGASNVTGRIYYVTDGDLRTIAGVFDAMARAAGARPLTIPIPLWAFSLAGSLGQLWSDMTGRPVLINRDKARELRAPHWCCDDGPMRRELGFAPRYGLDEGMADAVRWYRENRWL